MFAANHQIFACTIQFGCDQQVTLLLNLFEVTSKFLFAPFTVSNISKGSCRKHESTLWLENHMASEVNYYWFINWYSNFYLWCKFLPEMYAAMKFTFLFGRCFPKKKKSQPDILKVIHSSGAILKM